MKKVINNNIASISFKTSVIVMALITTFCLGFVGKGYGKTIDRVDTMKVFNFAYTIEMDRSEELEILEEVMNSGVKKVIETPITYKIYATNGNLLYQVSGSPLALMQDKKLNQLIENSNLMMEMANEYFYVRK
jgi:hypothetical protein